MRHRLTACAAGVAVVAVITTTLAGAALPSAQSAGSNGPKMLDKDTFMEMESVGGPSFRPTASASCSREVGSTRSRISSAATSGWSMPTARACES